ncbi:MAG: GDYXXLXY domain-containing protein [Synergistaceae bacterium]|jgi:uncharacterized membrane-anchored protein|nr:GDYXXLXY domain-containing protein [Synergistaceae bacterium]
MTETRFCGLTALKYAAMAVLPAFILLCFPFLNFAALQFGARVLLKTIPVDPRDFLRGDYVNLGYDIENIPEWLMPPDLDNLPSNRGDRGVYVKLDLDDDGVAAVSGVSFERPDGGLYLKGVLRGYWGRTCDYGLGVYYIPEGTGLELESKMRGGDKYEVYADVRVIRGRGVIKGLEIREID